MQNASNKDLNCRYNIKSKKNGEKIISTCKEPLKCTKCVLKLSEKMDAKLDSILERISDVSKITATEIQLQIIPSYESLRYYGIEGVETIIFNVFNTDKKSVLSDLTKSQVLIKVGYFQNDLYTIPILGISIYFLHELKRSSIEYFQNKLKREIVLFTGQVGDVRKHAFQDKHQLQQHLRTRLLLGQSTFQSSSILFSNDVGLEQTIQMDMLHAVGVFELDAELLSNLNKMGDISLRTAMILPELEKKEYETMLDNMMNVLFDEEMLDLPF